MIDVAGWSSRPGSSTSIRTTTGWRRCRTGPALLGPNVQQGITTTVAGNCGISPAPLGDGGHLGAVERMLLVG